MAGPVVPSTTSLFGWNTTTGGVSVTIPAGTRLGRYQLGVRGTNQGRSATATIDVDVVSDDPTAKAPTQRLGYMTQLGATAVPVIVAWPAATDPTSAIGGYQVQMSRNGGTWGSALGRSATHRDAVYNLRYGDSYAFRVRARDAAGNWSPWVAGRCDPDRSGR